MSSDAKIQVNIKTGAGFDATLINVYANDAQELEHLLGGVTECLSTIASVQTLAQGVGVLADAGVASATYPAPDQPSAQPPAVVAPPAPASSGPEVVLDRFNNRWTYGLADAPALPDGRGFYARKDWTSAKGQSLKAWVDPVKGPKPFQAGAVEADIMWIK